MAKPAVTASQPTPDDDDPDATGADTGTDTGADDEGGEDGPTVLLTVMDNHDGTYTLIKGDEDDGEEDDSADAEPGEGEDEGGDDTGADDESDTDAATSPDGEGEQGQTFDSPGALLKGILDIVKEAESEGGEGSAEDNFQAGFAGGAAASPPKIPPMQQKY